VQYFDKDIDGCVNFDDFLLRIRGKPNELRQEIINSAYDKFNKDQYGLIDIRDLKYLYINDNNRGVFNSSLHPKVISGEITHDQAFDQFLKNFNDKGGGKIDKYEWDDYYAAVSYSMESDEHFVYLVKKVWQLD
jgi:Ca2+-binding EF-hand superfamily protein